MSPAHPNENVFTRLLNEGPLPAGDIDTKIGVEQREDGIMKFNPSSNCLGSTANGGGMKERVYYVDGKHSQKSIIQTWLDANKKTVESVGKRATHWRICEYGEEWKEASRDILGPFPKFDRGTGGKTNIESCPMCESEIGESLAAHLPECPKG